MDKGLVSYGLDAAGNRQFETSELMRAYGALTSVAHPDTPEVAQVGTDIPWGTLLAELQALRVEVQELRAVVFLIEHKPDPVPELSPPSPPKPNGTTTWASLLDGLDEH